MAMVLRGALCAAAGGVLFVAAHTATAQPVNGCPAGQAMQTSDPSGKRITCVPIPDVSGLQGQVGGETAARQAADTQLQNNINAEAIGRQAADTGLQNKIEAETASRLGMDATLLQTIQDEASERKAEDASLRAAITEKDIVGSYAFTGTVLFLTSSNNFTGDFTPRAPALDGASTVTTIFNGVSS